MTPSISQADTHLTHYRTASVNSRKVFYREAGEPRHTCAICQKPSSFGWTPGTLYSTRTCILWRAKLKLSSVANNLALPVLSAR